ncbi:multicopper oxidase [Zopfia rhizophila CBS 207.26]|uniref:Multicopper oxidase n=1 Tax=Zopfia rhizophila CBS 207.26 TaxID=1314779 RepID=A0A6A6ENM7_9PEZI|nr:multicopper oxidase [Zopfia rhizophila CBS 207.26]
MNETTDNVQDEEERYALLFSWAVGFIIHSFLVPRKYSLFTPTLQAKLRPQEDYILDPKWDFTAKPTTREYHWTIADHELNPDGVYRPMILINGMFPGPLIECNEGDEIVVHIHNQATNATSLHWHGLYQNGTNWMDGTVGITQCPIAPGSDFTYRFRVEGQSGTYWYHSHMSVQALDGLFGPFVIHSREEKEEQKLPYGSDRVVMVSDHYYDLSSFLLMQYLSPDRENAEPVPDSALINGRGVRNCDDLPNRRCDNSTLSLADFNLEPDMNHRLRFINVGAFAEFQIQVDEHEFAVTEVDGTDVLPSYIHRLNINPAQRYSIVLGAPDPNKGLFWLRARMITHCFAEENPELQEEVRGVIRWWAPGDASIMPESRDWPEIIEVECRDLNTSDLHPVVSMQPPETADDQLYLRSNFEIGDWRLSRGFLNQSSWRADIKSPTLNRLIDGYSSKKDEFMESLYPIPFGINSATFKPDHELVYQTTSIRTIDVLIQNFDDGNHPFHLHGYKFWVLASGHGYVPKNIYENLDLTNLLRRDTASVEAFGWTLIRFVADNPGVWAFHCHISWHTEAGLLMQFLTRADEVATWTLPKVMEGLCGRKGIEKGEGPDDEIWVEQ